MPPACPGDPAITAVEVFDLVVGPHCGPCHTGGDMMGGLDMKDAPSLKANLVDVMSQGALLPRVTPGSLDESYVVYKILGAQFNAPGGSGEAMPLDEVLTDSQLCVVIDWIMSGAT